MTVPVAIRCVVVAHFARRAQAETLGRTLGAHISMDEEGRGATWGHRRALEWAAEQSERVIVLEDDALPVPGFLELAAAALARYPDDLVSLYLGSGRPPQVQATIAERLAIADRTGATHIKLATLVHGVCYSIPRAGLPRVLGRAWGSQGDYGIGAAWNRPVVYTVPSLVDHADGPSVERHADREPRTQPRRAWRLPGGGLLRLDVP